MQHPAPLRRRARDPGSDHAAAWRAPLPVWVAVLAVLATVLLGMLLRPRADALPPPPRIAGGTPVSTTDHSYMVALSERPDSKIRSGQFCGGAITARRYVVTSAVCVDRFTDSNRETTDLSGRPPLFVIAGRDDLKTQTGNAYNVESIQMQRSTGAYRKNVQLAVLKLGQDLPDRYASLHIPTGDSTESLYYAPGNRVTILGYGFAGKEAFENGSPSTRLLGATVPIIDDERCQRLHSQASGVVCAGDETKDGWGISACNGYDEGSPMVSGDILIGVFAFGLNDRCGSPWDPAAFSRMTETDLTSDLCLGEVCGTEEYSCPRTGQDTKGFTGTVKFDYEQARPGTTNKITGISYKIDKGPNNGGNKADVTIRDEGNSDKSFDTDWGRQDNQLHGVSGGSSEVSPDESPGYVRADRPITISFLFDLGGWTRDPKCDITIQHLPD